MPSVDDVAAAVLKRTGAVDTFKLEKLVYYCQAWHLAWEGRPLFRARIEAWANGPVVPKLYQQHRTKYTVGKWPTGDPDNFSEDEMTTIDAVVGHYKKFTGWQLAEFTHRERPWLEARAWGGLAPGERGNVEIPQETMRDYYMGLIQ